jgi:hypothetical protein
VTATVRKETAGSYVSTKAFDPTQQGIIATYVITPLKALVKEYMDGDSSNLLTSLTGGGSSSNSSVQVNK